MLSDIPNVRSVGSPEPHTHTTEANRNRGYFACLAATWLRGRCCSLKLGIDGPYLTDGREVAAREMGFLSGVVCPHSKVFRGKEEQNGIERARSAPFG